MNMDCINDIKYPLLTQHSSTTGNTDAAKAKCVLVLLALARDINNTSLQKTPQ